MKTETISRKTLAFIRVTGPYGENYDQPLDQLFQWAGEHGLQNGQCLFLYHDDPDKIPAAECRTDLCLTVPAGTEGTAEIGIQTLPEGRYCLVRKIIKHKDEYPIEWHQLGKQVKEAGFLSDDRPCFELYHSYDLETQVADVGFYWPVKDR